jgi:hypothetical protein
MSRTTNPLIIGVSAKKQGGKTTMVNNLKEFMVGWSVVRMADALKQVVIDCFVPAELGISVPDDLEDEETKMITLPCGKTIRQLLQIIGTDMFRGLWEDVWINAWKTKALRTGSRVILVPDVRFPNELKTIQAMGGTVVRLTRAPFVDDVHASETALDDYIEQFDFVLDNADMSMSAQREWTRDVLVKAVGA